MQVGIEIANHEAVAHITHTKRKTLGERERQRERACAPGTPGSWLVGCPMNSGDWRLLGESGLQVLLAIYKSTRVLRKALDT